MKTSGNKTNREPYPAASAINFSALSVAQCGEEIYKMPHFHSYPT
jgi:hypothetical protein